MLFGVVVGEICHWCVVHTMVVFPARRPAVEPYFYFTVGVGGDELACVIVYGRRCFGVIVVLPFIAFFRDISAYLCASGDRNYVCFLPFRH